MIDGSGSIPLTNGSGSGRPKNIRIRKIRILNTALKVEFTHIPSFNFFLMVEMSMGDLMIFLQVGNCLVLTGLRKGQDSSCPPSSDRRVWHTDSSLSIWQQKMTHKVFWVLYRSSAKMDSNERDFFRQNRIAHI